MCEIKENIDYIYDADYLERNLDNFGEVVIYGFGVYGKKVVDYIIRIGLKDKIKCIVITDNTDIVHEYKGIRISDARTFFCDKENRSCCVIIAVSLKYQSDIITTIEGYGVEKYYCFTGKAYSRITERLDAKIDERPRVPYNGIDFIIAGFTKCGTTSMYYALQELQSIYLPKEKETYFFWWHDETENPEEELVKRYFKDIRKGQKVGMIEPTFYGNAAEIYRYFGADIKVILMMRNPVDAAFSHYKMINRCGGNIFEDIYEKYGVYHEEMFQKYFECVVNEETYDFNYFYWMNKFMEFYPKEQILVILFEELMKSPQTEIHRLLKFIGVSEIYKNEAFPRKNEGNYVMGDIDGYRIAKRKVDLGYKVNTYPGMKDQQLLREFHKIQRDFEKAAKLQLTISEKEREILERHFNVSVRNLEGMLDRNLNDIWF